MNPFEMVVLIIAIAMIGSIIKARYGFSTDRMGRTIPTRSDAEAGRLKEEIVQLKERIAVLERLATDENGARLLDREIEKLR
ncbi:hypothetical protein [Sphingomonas sp. SUN039]|uniref:hypothetical protein n=1 Tax=Sphingomonas sp. SUN039 TaxID=2937787 RepID=UPI002164248D|nr:hypothetical protein [Sphingomonas sp. SUN039]UVO53836.1 hypothetical protein M0209_06755 [Sphingomonas sp. SUN039]